MRLEAHHHVSACRFRLANAFPPTLFPSTTSIVASRGEYWWIVLSWYVELLLTIIARAGLTSHYHIRNCLLVSLPKFSTVSVYF